MSPPMQWVSKIQMLLQILRPLHFAFFNLHVDYLGFWSLHWNPTRSPNIMSPPCFTVVLYLCCNLFLSFGRVVSFFPWMDIIHTQRAMNCFIISFKLEKNKQEGCLISYPFLMLSFGSFNRIIKKSRKQESGCPCRAAWEADLSTL